MRRSAQSPQYNARMTSSWVPKVSALAARTHSGPPLVMWGLMSPMWRDPSVVRSSTHECLAESGRALQDVATEDGVSMYSKPVLEHFQRPQNVGEIKDADGFGKATGGEHCPEDLAHFWIKVSEGRIVEIRQKTRGCPVAIAASSVTTTLAIGKTLEEAESLSLESVAQQLGELPERKLDSIVGPKALKAAIADYRARAVK